MTSDARVKCVPTTAINGVARGKSQIISKPTRIFMLWGPFQLHCWGNGRMPEARWCEFRPRGTATLDRNGTCILKMAAKQAEYNATRGFNIACAVNSQDNAG
jgi:hypothetical protein